MRLTTLLFIVVSTITAIAFAQDAAYLDAQAIETPPDWLVAMLESLHSMPIVGPILVKVVQWLGVILTIITSFTAAIWASIRALSTVLNWAGLVAIADKLKLFENSKFMYWLRYFSVFNAPKKAQ